MTSYRDAGVDLEGAARHVESISSDVTSTWEGKVIGGFGGFAAGVPIPDGYDDPILMMSTDGVGTKLELARRTGLWEGVGYDLVAMCVDDLAAVGAAPLGFVDYMAVGSLQQERDSSIVRSIAAACSEAECPLLGGETAEHPGVMDSDAVDLAGAVMGVVDRKSILDPNDVEEGQVVVGLRSPNLRSNGFSLVRQVFGEDIDQYAEALLKPSVIYSPTVLDTVETGHVVSAAHITGGGLAENLQRALPDGLGAEVKTSTWTVPEVFELVRSRGVDEDDMYRTFNMGVGYCLIARPEGVGDILDVAARHSPAIIGRITGNPGVVFS